MVEARDPNRQLQDPVVQIKRTDFRFPVIDPKELVAPVEQTLR